MQTFYSADYHSSNHLTPVMNSTTLIPSTGSNSPTNNSSCLAKFNDIDALNPSYSSYNNWSNGYNNYQYGSTPTAAIQTPTQTQYTSAPPPHTTPTMLIYPQVYSTVNQNQIHLHLHGADKIEQYLTSNDNVSVNTAVARNTNLDIGLSGNADNPNVIIEGDDTETHHHRSEHDTNNRNDQEVGDPSSVWRPY